MVDLDGRVNGEGDVLLPLYDNKYTTVFTQLGARSMSGMSGGGKDGRGADRWIGNLGIGQRWYPMSVNEGVGQDVGNWMLGYNVFLDNDFTRSHQRGGVGLEGQYDWLHLATNYYVPISGWKGSYDYDSNFVKERAAEGWDLRAKGYLPFYRNVALTGAYSQWKGDHVDMYSSSDLEKDPRVWSYGVEYTPISLVSGFVNQRSTERGRSDTEFGLRLTYHFQMPWDEQTSHNKVAEMRTVGGSRHEFVDRENRIILEYKAKDNHHIEFVSRNGNVFTFRLKHPFADHVAGKTVRVSATGVTTLAEAKIAPTGFLAQAGEFLSDLFSISTAHAADLYQTYVTDRNGHFSVTMTGHHSASTVTVQAGNTSRTFTAAELGMSGSALTEGILVNNSPADNATLNKVRARFLQADGTTPVVDGTSVNWSLSGTPAGITLTAAASNVSDGDGWAEMTLKDGQTGNRDVTVQATDGTATRSITVHFGAPVLTIGALVNGTPNPAINGSSAITSNVTFADGTAAINLPASSITWTTRNNVSASAQATTATSGTDATGKASFTATSNMQHVMYVQAAAGSSSQNTTVQFGATLPAGFIVGPGGGNGDSFIGVSLPWSDAVNYCQQQGGQLPARQNYSVTGGFPNGFYWSRQERDATIAYFLRGDSTGLSDNGGIVTKPSPTLVVCVQ